MPPTVVEPHTIPGGPDGKSDHRRSSRAQQWPVCPRSSTRTAGDGSWAVSRPMSDWCATWWPKQAPPSSSSTTPPPPRFTTRWPSSRCTPRRSGWPSHGAELGLDGSRLAVAGESVGGNMTAALTLLANERGGPAIRYQALLYPVTNADFDTETYEQFAEGSWLTRKAMQWFLGCLRSRSGQSRGADRLTVAGVLGAVVRAAAGAGDHR